MADQIPTSSSTFPSLPYSWLVASRELWVEVRGVTAAEAVQIPQHSLPTSRGMGSWKMEEGGLIRWAFV